MATTKRLTDRGVRAAGPGKHRDGAGHGLYVLVAPSGARRWKQRVTIRGRRRELGLGGYPAVSLAAARERARENAEAARAGRDPLAERAAAAAAAVTFAEAAVRVHAMYRPRWRSAKHAHEWMATLERFAFPSIGDMSVAEIDVEHVLGVVVPLGRSHAVTAKRVLQRIGVVLRWAVAHRLRADNPADAARVLLPSATPPPRPHRAVDYDDVSVALARVRDSRAAQATKLAFEFLVLTAARAGEVRFAVWSEIDLDRALWTVPGERMKAGRRHLVPLSGRALEVLDEARRLPGVHLAADSLVFPSVRGAAVPEAAFVQMLRRLSIDATAHGFRASFRTWAAERTSTPREVCEAALAHSLSDLERRYQRGAQLDARRVLMERWASFVSCAQPGVVVDIATAGGCAGVHA